MAKGITQDQVNAAADALVAAGDKPTVEKIRAALGTGSPNTVLRMLDAWRQGLAQRLQNVLQLPDVPAEVGQAVLPFWQLALRHAEAVVQEHLSQDRTALASHRAALEQDRVRWQAERDDALMAAQSAQDTAKRLEAQQTAQHALTSRMEAELADLMAQRDHLIAQQQVLQAELQRRQALLQEIQTQTAAERVATAEHLRVTENRAHAEVDRARQELKELKQQLAAAGRDHLARETKLATQVTTLTTALHAAERKAAQAIGRAEALQRQRTPTHAKTKKAGSRATPAKSAK